MYPPLYKTKMMDEQMADGNLKHRYPAGTRIKKTFNNGQWYPGTIHSGPYYFSDEHSIPCWQVQFDDGDEEYLTLRDLTGTCHTLETPKPKPVPPTNGTAQIPIVEMVQEEEDRPSPMDDPPLSEQSEPIFDEQEELPPHLHDPHPWGAPNPEQVPRDFSGQNLRMENPVESSTLPPEELIDRTFLMPPEEDGSRYRAKIMEMIKDHCEDNDFELQPERIKFKCLVNGQYKEVIAYNDIIDYIEADQTWDGLWKFRRILDHKGNIQKGSKDHMGSSTNVLIKYREQRNCLATTHLTGQRWHI